MASDPKVLGGVILGGDDDKVAYRNCPYCGEDLTNGVIGQQVLGLTATVAATDMKLSPTVVATTGGRSMVIDCPKCKRHLQMTGVLGQLWLYHATLQRARKLLNQLGQTGYCPPEVSQELQDIVAMDVYDKAVQYVPVDMNGTRFGAFDNYDDAYAEMANLGLADVRCEKTYMTRVEPRFATKDNNKEDEG